jgi:anti-sigma B factor antagonist
MATFPAEVTGGVLVVAAPEEVDIANADGLAAALVAAAGGGHRRFVADMTRTRFCDSSGISALVVAQRRARQEDSQLVLAVSPVVLRLLALTGLDGVIPHFPTLEKALRHARAVDGASGG